MDVLAIMTSSIQIIGFCSQCTISIVKWVGEVRTVDERIAAFYDEVNTLKGTYEGLNKTLRSPRMSEAAKMAAKSSDGAYLWAQLNTALDDSKATMTRVNLLLNDISSTHGIGRSIKKQLLESLRGGELSRLQRRIIFFNQNLSFPIQMLTVMLQLEQRDVSEEHLRQLDIRFVSLEREIRRLAGSLESSSIDSSTLMASPSSELDNSFEIKDYVQFAKTFLITASAAASTRSASSSSPEPPVRYSSLPSVLEHASHSERRMRINDWMVDQGPETQSSSARTQPTDATSDTSNSGSDEEENNDFWLRHASLHLGMGQEKLEQSDFESAAKCFRKALDLMHKNNFTDKLAHQPADVVLMLSNCYIKQGDVDEAIRLLEPVSNRRENIYPGHSSPAALPGSPRSTRQKPNRLQGLAASHMIGEAYLLKGDHDNASMHALKAFKNREHRLGERHAKTLESAQLLIQIYKSKGDEEEAEAFMRIASRTITNASVSSPLTSPVQFPELWNIRSPNQPPAGSFPTLPIQPDIATQKASTSQHARHSRVSSGSRWPFSRSFSSQVPHAARNSTASSKSNPDQVHINNDTIDFRQALISPLSAAHRKTSWPSTISTPERTSINEDVKPPDYSHIERASTSQGIEPVFTAVRQLCTEGKHKMALKRALAFMKSYKAQSIMLVREIELQENIKKGGDLGLAATGYGYAPIHYFTEIKDHECVDEVGLLIKQGVDVNAVACKAGRPGHNPLTPLQFAVIQGHHNITRLLLAVDGIKVDVKDMDGFSPILIACRKENHAIVAQLLAHGASIAPNDLPVTWYGNSLLHDAARQCDPTLVRLLLPRPHEIDGKDKFDRTPLIYAVIKRDITNLDEKRKKVGRRIETVKLLLDDGADKRIKDYKGKTAIDYAKEEDCLELVTVLESYIGHTRIAELDG